MGVGLAQGALDEALSYAKERQAFGQSISKFQAIQASSPTCRRRSRPPAAHVQGRAPEGRGQDFTLTAAQAKLKTGRLAVRCAEEAVQIHGGYGYIEEYPVCRSTATRRS
jgi:alkylation response protein AidB-like acyl-CoA dehydrogenase